MKKFLDFINIPKNIKRYIIIKKMDNYTKSGKYSIWVLTVDFLIFAALAATFYYIYFINRRDELKVLGVISIVLFIIFFIVRMSVFVLKYEKRYSGIEKLILIDEEGANIKFWDIGGKTSLLIGKNSKDNEVDIDLHDTEYASLISRQHAVMNYAGDTWYVEDIGSINGSGIKRINESSKFKFEKNKPYKVNSGDIIYVANTKLLAK